MGKHNAAFQEHFSEVTQTQLVTHTPEHDEQNDVRRVSR
jgi:hypothetical protein